MEPLPENEVSRHEAESSLEEESVIRCVALLVGSRSWRLFKSRRHQSKKGISFLPMLLLCPNPRIPSHVLSHLISRITLTEYYYPDFTGEGLETRRLGRDSAGETIDVSPTAQPVVYSEPCLQGEQVGGRVIWLSFKLSSYSSQY